MIAQIAPVQILGGFLLIATLSTLLANTAAYYVTGETNLRRSVLPGVAVAVVGLGAAVLPVVVVILAALAVDAVAVWIAYGLDRRGTAMVTVGHYTLVLVVNALVQNTLAIYQTAPG